eukprot:1646711-Alexandrium_andersonii.AAC.1
MTGIETVANAQLDEVAVYDLPKAGTVLSRAWNRRKLDNPGRGGAMLRTAPQGWVVKMGGSLTLADSRPWRGPLRPLARRRLQPHSAGHWPPTQ